MSGKIRAKVASIYFHPTTTMEEKGAADIVLLKLTQPVTDSDQVSICLPSFCPQSCAVNELNVQTKLNTVPETLSHDCEQLAYLARLDNIDDKCIQSEADKVFISAVGVGACRHKKSSFCYSQLPTCNKVQNFASFFLFSNSKFKFYFLQV